MYLRSLDNCKLKIGIYPPFSYNASGGGGLATKIIPERENIKQLVFDVNNFTIPDVNYYTTKFLLLPLPPGISIKIEPKIIIGRVNEDTGDVSLEFKAYFSFSLLNIYKAPDLIINTILRSTKPVLKRNSLDVSEAIQKHNLILSGSSTVNPTGNFIFDKFLGLPTKAFASLRVDLES